MTSFKPNSPTSGGAVPSSVTKVGGTVFDMIGQNGARVVSQLTEFSFVSSGNVA